MITIMYCPDWINIFIEYTGKKKQGIDYAEN